MKQQWCKMTYDHEQDRWMVDTGDYCYELHCGEVFDLLIGSTGIPCRIEYDHQWYVIMPVKEIRTRWQSNCIREGGDKAVSPSRSLASMSVIIWTPYTGSYRSL